MADRDGGPVARLAQPGAMRSFLRGLRVSGARVPFRNGRPFKNTDPFIVKLAATWPAMMGGIIAICAGSPDKWQWNVPTDTGVAIVCATTGAWVGGAVVRRTVEKGRRDLIQQGEIE